MRELNYSALLALYGIAFALRALAAWWIGPGTFGPDGAGATAAVALGGHPYPLHPLLIRLSLSAQWLSVFSGALTAVAAGMMGTALGRGPWGAGLAAAAAPLLLYPSALAGGDAPAIGAAALGVALAWAGLPGVGAALAACSLGIKPVSLPVLPLLLVALPLAAERAREGRRARAAGLAGARLLLGACLGAVPFLDALRPLLRPRPRGGLLGTWWLSTDGAPPALAEWPGVLWHGVELLAAVPTWTGHPVVGLLAVTGALWPGPRRRERVLAAALGGASLLAVAALLGDRLDPRYLGAPSLLLTVLAGCALTAHARWRAPWLALALAWPALAVVSQVAAVRAAEEAGPERPAVPWPGVAAQALYRDGGVCGGEALRTIAAALARELPPGAEVAALRLRDGREGELRWPLLAARPDLKLTVIHRGCCGGEGCEDRLTDYSPEVLVVPGDLSHCATEVVDFGELELARALARPESGAPFAVVRGTGGGAAPDACAAMR